MQNLSLQAPQNAGLSQITSPVNKSDVNANTDSGSSFKDVFSSQVRNQQAENQQSSNTQNQPDANASQGIDKTVQSAQSQQSGSAAEDKRNSAINKMAKDLSDSTGSSNTLKTGKKLADTNDTSTNATDNAQPVPFPTDAAMAALGLPIQASIPTLDSTKTSSAQDGVGAGLDSNMKAGNSITPSLGSSSVLLQGDAANKNGLNDAKQSVLASPTGQSDQGLSNWVANVVDSKSTQAGLTIGEDKLGAITAKDLQANNSLLNVSTSPAILATTNSLSLAQVASSNIINATPGRTGWDQAISQKMVWMVGSGDQSATLTLNPPDLGPLQVVIHVHNDQADATFISDNSEVRRALHDGLSNLKDMLGQSGINLGQANINSSQQQQQQAQQSMGNNTGSADEKSVSTLNPSSHNNVVSNAVSRVTNGLVDTFA
jgi:flagellar hook-length control protein FliK